MCGRFALFTPMKELAAVAAAEPLSELTPFAPSWNVCPQQHVPVATEVGVDGEQNVQRHFRLMQWGFRPSWAKPSNREPINARRETVHDKPMFRRAAEQRRGVVPADGWYEWMTTPRGKVPFYHKPSDDALLLMAGIYEHWRDEHGTLNTFSLLTKDSTPDVSHVHNRMPVLLEANNANQWLTQKETPSFTSRLEVFPVGREVNKTSAKGPQLIQKLRTLFD